MNMYKTLIPIALFFIVAIFGYTKISSLQSDMKSKMKLIDNLEEQMNHLQNTNNNLLDRLSDLSVINKTEAKSIHESLQSLNKQTSFVHELSERIHHKDSINFALVSNLKRSLMDFDDHDIQIEVKGSAVYVSISDNMMFRTGSARISNNAHSVLSKVASVINDHDEINVLVEGHTDNVPISNNFASDNWDLSVLRATSVVRTLQGRYGVSPERLTAAGRSSYLPKSNNETSYGRSLNRRTEIIITPKLDQFFKLLESDELLG